MPCDDAGGAVNARLRHRIALTLGWSLGLFLAAGATPSTPSIVAQVPGAPTSAKIVVAVMSARSPRTQAADDRWPNHLIVRPAVSPAKRQVGPGSCAYCGRDLNRTSGFVLGGAVRCLRCALCYWPMLRRSTVTAVVVGTILVAINQGAVLVEGTLGSRLLWQIPLTYVVPFCVATWGALSNSRG